MNTVKFLLAAIVWFGAVFVWVAIVEEAMHRVAWRRQQRRYDAAMRRERRRYATDVVALKRAALKGRGARHA
jgi:hypothetical protein